jgi:CheY-like chemotaxis protein
MRKDSATKWTKGTILAIEDDPGDREIMHRALRGEGYRVDLFTVADGKEALDYLFRRGCYADPSSSPRPDLILLDLNLPGIDGKKVLEIIKDDEDLCTIPIVIVTTSIRDRDVFECYRLGCNSYTVKPLEAHAFIEAVHDLCSYWLGAVTLPRHDPGPEPGRTRTQHTQ